MSELKTKATSQSVTEFLNTVEPDEKRSNSFEILAMMEKITGEKAVMWGTSIVGFGLFHYKSERSKQEGDWPLIAFSPRKQNITLYILEGNKDNREELKGLGKHKASGGCLHINRLSDVNQTVLAKLIEKSFKRMKEKHK